MAEPEYRCRVETTLDAPWTLMPAVALGGPSGGVPDEHVLVEADGVPFLRLDVHRPPLEYHLRTEAEVWEGWIVVGFGIRVELVAVADGARRVIGLSEVEPPGSFDYFCRISREGGVLLIASGSRLLRIRRDGEVIWKSEEVGADGVLVHSVGGGVVEGDGEWDPPDGWASYTVCLETGKLLAGGDPFEAARVRWPPAKG